jgi:plastocyanin
LRLDVKRRRYVVASVIAVAGFAALFAVLPSQGAGTKVRMVGVRYRPDTIRIAAGGAVTFHNESKVVHTATCAGGCRLDSKDIQPGTIRTLTFPKAGTYQLFCRYHGTQGMVARLTVTPSG